MSSVPNVHYMYMYFQIYICIKGHVVSVKRALCVYLYQYIYIYIRSCRQCQNAHYMLSVCVRCQLTLRAIGNIIFLRDSGNQRCELLAVIVRRDHLIQTAFHPLLLL